jgi:integrase
MPAKISNRLLQSGESQPREREFEIRDSALRGFMLRVLPTGRRAYYVQYRRGQKIRLGDVGTLTPDEARERAQKVLGNVAHGRPPLQGIQGTRAGNTLGAFIESSYQPYLQATRPNGAAATVKRLQGRFDALSGLDISAITSGDLERWKAEKLAAGASPATVQRDLMPLSGVFRYAKKLRLVTDNPVADVDKPRLDSTGMLRYLTPVEETRLRDELHKRDQQVIAARQSGNRWREQRGKSPLPQLEHYGDALTPAVLVSLNTGLRLGELLKLQWSDIDFDARTLTVRGGTAKSGKTRHIPMNEEAFAVLLHWRPNSGTTSVYGIKTSFKKSFAKILESAQISEFRWHDLRHTFASKLAQRGVPLNTIRDLLGHGSLTMTLRYAHLSPDNRRNAVHLLSGAA